MSPKSRNTADEMTTAMILIRHESDQNIRLRPDRVIIAENTNAIAVHHRHVHITRDLVGAAQAVAVIIVAFDPIDRKSIRDVASVHRVVQAMAVTNVISIHTNEAIRVVIAANKVVIEFPACC